MDAKFPVLADFWWILEASAHSAEDVLRVQVAHVSAVVDDHGWEE